MLITFASVYTLFWKPLTFRGDIETLTSQRENTFHGISNPAAAYCIVLGYKYSSENGIGYCIFIDGSKCEEWSFYAGKCGQTYSYCTRQGYLLETRNDGKDPYSREYSACVLPDGTKKPASELMNLSQFISR